MAVAQTDSQALAAKLKELLAENADLNLECEPVENQTYEGHPFPVASVWNGNQSYPRIFIVQLVGRFACLLDVENSPTLDEMVLGVQWSGNLDQALVHLRTVFC